MNDEIKTVYNKIANHFSITRVNHWAGIYDFINSLPQYCLIVDIGCGNGKNMLLKDKCFIGMDLSEQFCYICNERNLNTITADNLHIPFRSNSFDYAISIAVIHHLKTEEHRLLCIKNIVNIVKPGGQIFIQVWAFEQPHKTKNKFIQQENMVQWKLQSKFSDQKKDEVLYRYYYVFKENELDALCNKIYNIKIINSFYEHGNWCIILEKLE